MKRKKLIVRAVSLFMVGLITTLALIIPTSAIMTEYPTEDNTTYYDCVMPFNVNFVGTDGTLDYVYSVPVGYNSPVVQTGLNGHDTLTGRVLGDGGVTPNVSTLEYYYCPTEWRIGYDGTEYDDGWGGVPVELRIDNTEIDGKTIVIDAPTFYVNPLVSNWYRTADPDTYNRWAMGAFRMPSVTDPSTQAYVGRYTVYANVVDDVGTKHPVSYSKVIDTRTDNNWTPFLEPSIFQDYVINSIQETGYNRIVAVTDFKAYVDYDYYEFVNVIEPSSIDIKVYALNGNLVHSDGFNLTDSIGLTFSEWASQFSENNYSVNVSNDGVELTYTSGTDTYTGEIYDGINQVLGSTRIAEGVEYGATLNYNEPPVTTDELAGTWVLNDNLDDAFSDATAFDYSVNFTSNDENFIRFALTISSNRFLRYYRADDYQVPVYKWETELHSGYYVEGNEKYKIFTITSNLSEVTNGEALLTWLKANATKLDGSEGSANSLDDGSVVAFLDTPTTTATGGEWQLVEGSPLKATGIDVSYPVYERNEFTEGEMALNHGYPDFDRYISKFRGVGNLDVNADFTGWIATATSGFLNFELLPNFSIGGVLAILVGFSLVILFLKVFAGG